MKQADRILTAKEQEEHSYPVYGPFNPSPEIDTEELSVAQDAKTLAAFVAWQEGRVQEAASVLPKPKAELLRDGLKLFKAEFGVTES